MGWMETCAVDERMRFVMAIEKEEESFAGICRRFGVSRKTGYKWLSRYEGFGVEGLADRSRAPLDHPQSVPAEIADRCLEVRRRHPTWGPVKVRASLMRRAPLTRWPASSTIGELFDREGLTVKRRLRRRSPPSSAPFSDCTAANDVWCIDFKGWFLTGDGARCEPLTLSDAHSRYLLRCQALQKNDAEHAWPVLYATFREFGLPKVLRSDNGPPFASCGAGGLSQLAVKVVKAGVRPERIEPGETAAERPAGAVPPHAAPRYRRSARVFAAPATGALCRFQAPLQRGASPCRARQCHARRTLHPLAAALRWHSARARI